MLNGMLHASDWLFCHSIHSHKIKLLFMTYLKQTKNGLRYQIRMWQTVHHSLCLIHLHNQLNTKHNWYVCLVLRGITLSWAKGKLKVWKLKFLKLILIKRHACLQDCNTCLNNKRLHSLYFKLLWMLEINIFPFQYTAESFEIPL